MPDVAELSPSRRFVAVDKAAALPGCCYFCRNDEGPLIDTGISEDMFGVVYVCKSCALEMAQNFGAATPLETSRMRAEIEMLQKHGDLQKEQIRQLKEENHGFRTVIRFGDNPDLLPDSDSSVESVRKESGEPEKPKRKGQSFLSGTDQGSSE